MAKPGSSVQPYVDRAEAKLRRAATWLVVVSLIVGLGFSWSLAHSIQRLAAYANAAAEGRRAQVPRSGGPELQALAEAVATMRDRLEGRDYVEHYVHTLTHEMKSPLAAIAGAAELLQEELPTSQRERFTGLIAGEAERLQQLVDRLLALATVEQRRELQEQRPVILGQAVEELIVSRTPAITQKRLQVDRRISPDATVFGERFLIVQAIGNLLDNALDFTPDQGAITITAEPVADAWRLRIANTGSAIPDYAHARLFERFYSLPRPGVGRKSTGLGLAFVQEVAHLHGGTISVENRLNTEGTVTGVAACLTLPGAM